MTLYSLILFCHVVAALGLFATLTIEVVSLFHLRQASDMAEVRRWIDPIPGLPFIAIASILLVFVSGIYLAARMSAFDTAWPRVTIGALLLIAPFGALTGKRIGAIRTVSAQGKARNSELIKRVQDPFLNISLGIRLAVFLGILLLMTAKPGLWQSIEIVATSVVLGSLLSVVVGRRAALATPSAHPEG
jgi:hypothetical protein